MFDEHGMDSQGSKLVLTKVSMPETLASRVFEAYRGVDFRELFIDVIKYS